MNDNVLKKIYYFIFSLFLSSVIIFSLNRTFNKRDIVLIPITALIIFYVIKQDIQESFAIGVDCSNWQNSLKPECTSSSSSSTVSALQQQVLPANVRLDIISFPAEEEFSSSAYIATNYSLTGDTDVISADDYLKQQTQKYTSYNAAIANLKNQENTALSLKNAANLTPEQRRAREVEYNIARNARIYAEEEQSQVNKLVAIAQERLDAAKAAVQTAINAKRNADLAQSNFNNAQRNFNFQNNDRNRLQNLYNTKMTLLDAERKKLDDLRRNITVEEEVIRRNTRMKVGASAANAANYVTYENNVTNAESKIGQLRNSITEQNLFLASLQSNINQANARLAGANNVLQRANAALTTRNNELNTAVAARTAAIDQATKAINDARTAAATKTSTETNQLRILNLLNQIRIARNETDKEKAKAEIDKKALQDNINALNNTITQKDNELATANATITAKNTELKTVQDSYNKLEAEKKSIASQISANSSAASVTQSKLDEKQTVIDSKNEQLIKISGDLGRAEASIEILQKQNDEINDKYYKPMIEAQKNAASAQATLTVTQQNLVDANKKIAALEDSIRLSAVGSASGEILQTRINELKDEVKSERDKYEKANAEYYKKIVELSTLTSQKEKADSDLAAKIKENADMKKSYDAQIATLNTTIANLEKDKKDLNDQIIKLSADNKTLVNNLQKVNDDLSKANEKITKLEVDKQNLQNRITELETDKASAEQEIKLLRSQNSTNNNKISILQEESLMLKKNNQILLLQIANSSQKNKVTDEESRIIQNRLNKLAADLQAENAKSQQNITQLNTEKTSLQSKLNTIQTERDQYFAKSQLLISTNADLEEEIRKLKSQKTTASNTAAVLQSPTTDQSAALAAAKAAADEKDQIIAQLTAQNAAAKKALQIANDKSSAAEQEKSAAQKRIGELQDSVSKILMQLDEYKKKAEEVNTQQTVIERIVKVQETQPNLNDEQLKLLEQQKANAEQALAQKQKELDRLQAITNNNASKYQSLQEELDNAYKIMEQANQNLAISSSIQKTAENMINQNKNITAADIKVMSEDIKENSLLKPAVNTNDIIDDILSQSLTQLDISGDVNDKNKIVEETVKTYGEPAKEAADKSYNKAIINIVKQKVLSEEDERDKKIKFLEMQIAERNKLFEEEKIKKLSKCVQEKQNEDQVEYEIEVEYDDLQKENKLLKENCPIDLSNRDQVKEMCRNNYGEEIYDDTEIQYVCGNMYGEEFDAISRENQQLKNEKVKFYDQQRFNYVQEEIIEKLKKENEKIKKEKDKIKNNINLNVRVSNTGKRDRNSIMNQRNQDLHNFFFTQYA